MPSIIENPKLIRSKSVPAVVESFIAQKNWSEDHWLNLGIFLPNPEGHAIPPILPLIVELIEVDKQKNWKRGDIYHFAWYHTDCEYHGFCELPLGKPLDTRGNQDTDISRLLHYQDEISNMLDNYQAPTDLHEHLVVKALRNKTLE